MNLDKLFGSNAKVDILKYLIFRRQGVSMRALESELERTYPAIKKQVDTLYDAGIFEIDKDNTKRAISLNKEVEYFLKNIFLFSFKKHIITILKQYGNGIKQYYFGKCFGVDLEVDLVLVYENIKKEDIDELKKEVGDVAYSFFISRLGVTCMTQKERDQRYRLADKFVLNILRKFKN